MKKFVLLALLGLFAFVPNAHAKASCQSSQVIMFMTQWCPYCRAATAFLGEHAVDLKSVDIEHPKDDEERALIQEHYRGKARGVPHLLIEGRAVSGFYEPRVRELLCIVDE